MTRVRDKFRILEQGTLANLERRFLPIGPPSRKFLIGDVDIKGVLHGIDQDDVAVVNKGKWTANLSLGNDVANDEAVGPVLLKQERDVGKGKGKETVSKDFRGGRRANERKRRAMWAWGMGRRRR